MIKFDLSAFDGLENAMNEQMVLMERLIGSASAKRKIRKCLNLIRDNARARVHVVHGHLRPAIKVRVKTSAEENTVATVGVSYKLEKKAHHAHLVEEGHGGPHPAPPHPFWEPAVDATGEEALDALADAVNDLIDELWK